MNVACSSGSEMRAGASVSLAGDVLNSGTRANVTFLDATLNKNGVSMMQTIPVAVTKKVQRLNTPAPNCVMFIPKNEVKKLSGMKIKANLISLATLVAV